MDRQHMAPHVGGWKEKIKESWLNWNYQRARDEGKDNPIWWIDIDRRMNVGYCAAEQTTTLAFTWNPAVAFILITSFPEYNEALYSLMI